MARTPEEAEKMSNDNKSTNTQKTVKEGPMPRSRTRELDNKINLKNYTQTCSKTVHKISVHNKIL
jgi:hypothetical protein